MAGPQRGTRARGHTNRSALRSALWLPIFDELADPVVVAWLAAQAGEAGWHGVVVRDHLRWRTPVRQVADPQITLAAIAATTHHLRLGPMVTPLARRRPAKVARQTATLDRLSGGRLTLGHPDQLAEVVAIVVGLCRHSTAPYDFAVGLPPGSGPAPYAAAGATWWLVEFAPEAVSLDEVRGVLRDGPAAA